MSSKRKRSATASALMVYRPYGKTYTKRRKTFVPGRDRVGGFYGRYAGRDAELKFFDLDIDKDPTLSAGFILNAGSVNNIASGTQENQRIGRKCTIRSIHLRYLLLLPEQDAVATPAIGDSLRIIVYQDKQANGAAAAILDILETANIHSFRNLANSGRFNVLCDKLHNVNYAGLASDGAGVVSQAGVSFNYVWNKKVNIPLEFSSTTGATTEIRSNNLGILLIGNQGVVGYFSQLRLRFSDQG